MKFQRTLTRKKYKILFSMVIISAVIIFLIRATQLNEKPPKVIIFGVDGAEWTVINKLIEEGKLPNFKKFMNSGSYGYLISPYSFSPITWTEIASGTTNEVHGIQDFFNENGSIYLSSDVKVKRIWNYLSEGGVRVGVYKYYITWPAQKVNGFMISQYYDQEGVLPYYNSTYSFYPQFLSDFYFKSNQKISFPPKLQDIDTECQNILKLFSIFKPDFYIAYDNNLHVAEHSYWKFFFPQQFNLSNKTEIEIEKSILANAYMRFDNCLGEVSNIAPDYNIIIVSDHGMTEQIPISYEIFFDNLMNDLNISNVFIAAHHLATFSTDGKYVLTFSTANSKTDLNDVMEKLNRIQFADGTVFFEKISVFGDKLTISIDKDKFIKNFVKSSSDDELSLYYLVPLYINGQKFSKLYVWEKSGEHPPNTNGIIIAKGSLFKKNFTIQNATVYDITPTILFIYNVKTNLNFTGAVIKDAINQQFLWTKMLTMREQNFVDSKPNNLTSEKIPKVNQTDLDEIKNQLRKIGYVV